MTYEKKLRFILNHYGLRKQMIKLFEELGELSIEISKFLLGRGNRTYIGSEMADVLVMIEQLIIALDMTDYVEHQKEFKVNRQIKRITDTEEDNDEH